MSCLFLCVVVLDAHLVLSVLACTGHNCCLCVCAVVLRAKLVLSIFAAFGI